MGNEGAQSPLPARERHEPRDGLPQPTAAFRRRAWLQFQRAIDPLAPPKPLKLPPP